MIAIADFRLRFPEFEDDTQYRDARIQMFIDDAVLMMEDDTRWLNFYNVAQMYLTAHYLAVAISSEGGDTNAQFPISKQEVDDVLIEQAVSDKGIKPTTDNLHSTIYGQQYYRYIRMVFSGPIGT